MGVRFLDLARQYQEIKPAIDKAIADVIRDTAFVSGPYVTRFEELFSAYQQAPYCVACGNGTDALELALESLHLPSGGEVVVPANSFVATAEAVTRSGLKVVFCDCDPADYTISIESLRAKITTATKAVIVVHLYGHPCNMDAIREVTSGQKIRIIEDCAQAHGAEYSGRRVGTIGDAGAFSFYPGKNLGAYGDAGAVVTRDEGLAKRIRMIANHGRVAKYDHAIEGRNSRMDGLQGAILTAKLPFLDGWLEQRRGLAKRYRDGLEGVGDLVIPEVRIWAKHSFHLYVVRTQHRDRLREFLRIREIETGVHYPIALPKLEAYRHLKHEIHEFVASQIDGELLSLPIGDHMTMADADEVIAACQEYFRSSSK